MTDLGRDVFCLTSLRTGKWATGVRLVGQRLYHALTTPRGTLQGDEHHQNWGDDLTDCIGLPGGPVAEATIRAKVNRAAGNDETIQSVSTRIVSSQDPDGSWSHSVTVDAVTSAGPFQLVIPNISDLTVAQLGFPQEAT